jgi:peptide/nickel transport system substrate-binding protein
MVGPEGRNAMQRRSMLKAAAGFALLAAPRLVQASSPTTLRFVPVSGLVILDPVATTGRVTRNHGFLVFDTLYGLDETLDPQPQMVMGHTIEDNGKRWTLTLRDQLRFHDGEKVRGRDVVASIRRFGARDGLGQSLMAATDELSAPDDQGVVFQLKKPFPHLAQALAGGTGNVAFVMPERLASTDPYKPITEVVGSGPYRFVASEFMAGARSVYERFGPYAPCEGQRPSFLAGPKIAHFDRIEWTAIPDPATAAAAIQKGEVDWWELPSPDLVPLLARDRDLELATMQTAIGIMRFNHLHPPFDNPEIRRALLGAVDQAAAMQAVAGTDPAGWRDHIGLFPPETPLANDAGVAVLDGPRDYAKVRRELTAAGYHGERVVALDTTDISVIHALTLVGVDELRQGGMNVDVQSMDFGTMVRRRASRQPIQQGGWNVFFTFMDSTSNFTPAGNPALRGNGVDGWDGWPTSPRLEELRQVWLDAGDLDAEKRACRELQLQLWQDVPYIPMGQYSQQTCYRRTLADVPKGPPLFFGVRPA